MNEVTSIVQALINIIAIAVGALATAGVAARIVVWVKARFEEFKATQPENIQTLIEWAVKTAAEFAEKVDLSGQLEDYARSKKAIALKAAHDLLLSVGFDVDLSVLDAALESFLFRNPEQFPSSKG